MVLQELWKTFTLSLVLLIPPNFSLALYNGMGTSKFCTVALKRFSIPPKLVLSIYEKDVMLTGQVSDAELQQVTEQMWAADSNRFSNADMTYNIAGPT